MWNFLVMFLSKWDRYTYLAEFRRRLQEFGPEDERVLRFIEVYYPDPDSKEMAYDELWSVSHGSEASLQN
jgi:hypothetical protein